MSRLGDLLLLERTRQHLTRKQVARKVGVSENYLKDVEEGRRIIQDDQARRILKTLGSSQTKEAEFSLDEIAATVDLGTIKPVKEPTAPSTKIAPDTKRTEKTEDSGIWLEALSSVIKSIPVMNAGWVEVDHRILPVLNGKIEGANPEKVYYYKVPDDTMKAFRIEKDDLILLVPQSLPLDDSIMLCEYKSHRCLRRIRILGHAHLLLQNGSRELDAVSLPVSEVKIIARAIRCEFSLE